MEILDNTLLDLKWGVERSIHYHDRRRQFFGYMSLAGSLMCIISGLIISILLSGLPKYSVTDFWIILSFLVIILIFGILLYFRIKIDQYDALYHRFIILQKEIIRSQTPSILAVQSWTAQRLTIEIDEPPVLRILDMMYHNELLRAKGYSRKMQVKITRSQRLFAQFFDYKEHSVQLGK